MVKETDCLTLFISELLLSASAGSHPLSQIKKYTLIEDQMTTDIK